MVILHCHILQFLNSQTPKIWFTEFWKYQMFPLQRLSNLYPTKALSTGGNLDCRSSRFSILFNTYLSINLERDVPYSGMVLKFDHFNCSDTRRNLYHESRRSHEFTSVMCYTSLLLLILHIHNQLLKYTFIICRYNLETSTKC